MPGQGGRTMKRNDVKKLVRGLLGHARRNPIKRDDRGKSARQRAFGYFVKGFGPSQTSCFLPISARTARRYYHDWKKLPPEFQKNYEALKRSKRDPEFKKEIVKFLAEYLEVSKVEIEERLQKPWGLKQLAMGIMPDPGLEWRQHTLEGRLKAALKIVIIIEHSGKSPEKILEILERLMYGDENINPGKD